MSDSRLCECCHRWRPTSVCCNTEFCDDCHYLHRRYYHGDKSEVDR